MYDYEDSVKKNNVGFARVESRNGQCKIVINIKALSLNSSNLKGYIFKRMNGKIVPIFMGNISVKNGIGDFRTTTNSNRMINTDADLNQMCGIIVYYSKDKFYATEWDDNPIKIESIEDFEEPFSHNTNLTSEAPPVSEQKTVSEPQIIHVETLLTGEIESIVSSEECSKTVEQQEAVFPIMKYKKLSYEQPSKNRKTPTKSTQTETFMGGHIAEEEEDSKANGTADLGETPPNPSAARIFSRFTAMYPFETKEIMECVRIEPQDIGVFPIENWILGNNSFLLHGYYNYRHLIFARRRTESSYQYIIGVPGVYQNREKFVARMFGFEYFQPTEIKEEKTGEFGYWFTPVVL